MRICSGHIRNLTGPALNSGRPLNEKRPQLALSWGRQPNGASLGAKTRKVGIFEDKRGARSAPLCVNFTSVPLSCSSSHPHLVASSSPTSSEREM